jgi:DNA-binding response OmpR family regulator
MDTSLNIIVVEDNDDLRQATVEALQAIGHVVRGVDCAEALDDELGAFRADLLVLDLNLPGEDGISLAQRVRQAEPGIGIIMLTARNQLRDKMRGYESGADIYLTKPTSVQELGAAIAALARRIRPSVHAGAVLTLNLVTLQLQGPVGAVDVSNQEATLLSAFAKARDRRLEHWQLTELSGKPADDVSKNAMEVQIVRLRKRLEQAGAAAPTIKAIRGTGYQLCIAVEVRQN